MKISDNGSWLNETNEGQRFDVSLASAIEMFCYDHNLRYIIDLGCGDGSYVVYFNTMRALIASGYDGNPYVEQYSSCYTLDLSKPIELNHFTIDLIISLEVGEHIPVKYESIFIDNVVKYAKEWIILSWAIPGQGGDGHVNCRDNEYIIEKMAERRFIINWHETFKLRAQSTLSWFKNTLMVFQWVN